jgi:hypothetical protein
MENSLDALFRRGKPVEVSHPGFRGRLHPAEFLNLEAMSRSRFSPIFADFRRKIWRFP